MQLLQCGAIAALRRHCVCSAHPLLLLPEYAPNRQSLSVQAKGLNKLGLARNRGPGLPALQLFADVDMNLSPSPLPTVSESTTESGRVVNIDDVNMQRASSGNGAADVDIKRPSMDFMPEHRCALARLCYHAFVFRACCTSTFAPVQSGLQAGFWSGCSLLHVSELSPSMQIVHALLASKVNILSH